MSTNPNVPERTWVMEIRVAVAYVLLPIALFTFVAWAASWHH